MSTKTIQHFVTGPSGKLVPIVEVYESFSGWYWFITEIESKPIETTEGTGFVAYGKVYGFETEWGEIWMPEIEEQIKKGRVWKVPKSAWSSISHVVVK